MVALLLALHAAVDGLLIGSALGGVREEDVLEPHAVSLQVLHRALEGGVLVSVMLLAGVRKLRILAATFYVGLPTAVTTPLVLLTRFVVLSSVSVVLSFMEASAFFLLLLIGLWPALSPRVDGWKATAWLLVGFLVTFLAHALAH